MTVHNELDQNNSQSVVITNYDKRVGADWNTRNKLMVLGSVFYHDIADPSPKDWEDYLRQELELRLSMAAEVLPHPDIHIPRLTITHDQLQEFRSSFESGAIALGLDLPEDIPLEALAYMYPNTTGHWITQQRSGLQSTRRSGYFFYEAVNEAPYTDTSVEDLIGVGGIEEQTGLRLMYPTEYVIAAYGHRPGMLHGDTYYFDTNSWTRIRDPRTPNAILDVSVHDDNMGKHSLVATNYWKPTDRRSYVGARLLGEL